LINKILSEFLSVKFIKFIAASGLAAAVNFSSRIFLNRFFSFPVAIFFAYMAGMFVAFVLGKTLVFKPGEKNLLRQILFFASVNSFAVAQTIVVSVVLVDYILPQISVFRYNKEIAHFIGISIPMFSSFLGHKHITFASPKLSGGKDVTY
jgi:putative flippase GtrA